MSEVKVDHTSIDALFLLIVDYFNITVITEI
jgi:hypothetical protein